MGPYIRDWDVSFHQLASSEGSCVGTDSDIYAGFE